MPQACLQTRGVASGLPGWQLLCFDLRLLSPLDTACGRRPALDDSGCIAHVALLQSAASRNPSLLDDPITEVTREGGAIDRAVYAGGASFATHFVFVSVPMLVFTYLVGLAGASLILANSSANTSFALLLPESPLFWPSITDLTSSGIFIARQTSQTLCFARICTVNSWLPQAFNADAVNPGFGPFIPLARQRMSAGHSVHLAVGARLAAPCMLGDPHTSCGSFDLDPLIRCPAASGF
ncbi:hypothetical protein B0H19DRAFT_1073707 [Mycena capillaripes]|nr:hypothetical protein B0H19DRAFT_1073707 [Mycena capillaripes]